jgi:hypothetical protein
MADVCGADKGKNSCPLSVLGWQLSATVSRLPPSMLCLSRGPDSRPLPGQDFTVQRQCLILVARIPFLFVCFVLFVARKPGFLPSQE